MLHKMFHFVLRKQKFV